MKNVSEVGFVQSVFGPVIFLDGLPGVSVGEVVVSETGVKGFVGSLFPDRVEVFLLSTEGVSPGEMFKKTGNYLGILAGDHLLGRAINPLGEAVDGLGILAKNGAKTEKMNLDQRAVGISGRRFITEQFDTGITLVDTLFPLGKGQRELVIGEQRSGKTQFLLDIVANLKGTGVVCVYGLIGKPIVETINVLSQMSDQKLIEYCVMVVSCATDPAPLTFLTAQTAMTIAQYFQRQGRDVLLILDDMGVQARNYREMALISKRPPGRESYPGDIFYQQARLLERAGCFKVGGSITALPVVELVLAEFSGFIPTNLMGMTDGHLLFKSGLSQQGKRPAIDLFLSVTRLGGQSQNRVQNLLATKIKGVLARANQLEVVSRFGSELPVETKTILLQKQQIEELLNQKSQIFVSNEIQTIVLSLPFTSWFKDKDIMFLRAKKEKIFSSFLTDAVLSKFAKQVFTKKDLPELFAAIETIKPQLDKIVTNVSN